MKPNINFFQFKAMRCYGSYVFRQLIISSFISLTVLGNTAYADASCAVNTSGISFGAYDVFNPIDTDSTGNINVICTGLTESTTVAYDVIISTGGGSYASRAMHSEGHLLTYNLYTNNSRSTVWGDGSAGTQKISDGYSLGLSAVAKDYSIYGRIPARQNAYVGTYNDTIIITVNYQ